MELTTTHIEALTEAGGSRWTKSGMDRIYFDIDTIPGVEIRNPQRRGGYLTLDDETFSNRCDMSIRSCKLWVDVATGETHAKYNGDRKVAGEVATIVERFKGLVAGLLAVEEITADPDAEVATDTEQATEVRVKVRADLDRRAARRAANRMGHVTDVVYIDRTFIVPAGTWDRLSRGEHLDHELPIEVADFEVVK